MNLSGKKAQDFIVWLHIAKAVLPPSMSLKEAQDLFLRKMSDEEEVLSDEENKKNI